VCIYIFLRLKRIKIIIYGRDGYFLKQSSQELVRIINVPLLTEDLHGAQTYAISKDCSMNLDFQCTILINARSALNSLKKYNEITPVYVSTETHLYNCYHYFKPTNCDKHKINTGYALLQSKFRVNYVGNSPMTCFCIGLRGIMYCNRLF
jgi:hypothetical protein